MKIKLYQDDIPSTLKLGDEIAIDSEAMGLNHQRDRLCLIQNIKRERNMPFSQNKQPH